MKPWQLGDGDNTVSTEQLRMEFIFDSINRQLAAIGVTDQTTFDAFANYIGYSTGGTPSYQDMQVAWTPTNAHLNLIMAFTSFGSNSTITEITNNSATLSEGIDWEFDTVLQTLNFPLLTSVSVMTIGDNTALTSLSLPLLSSIGVNGQIQNMPLLTSLSLPSLVSCVGNLSIGGNGLTSISLPAFLPTSGTTFSCAGNALLVASVDHILARCVASAGFGVGSQVLLNNGTNAHPSSTAPGSDYDTLLGRGVAVSIN